MRREPWSKGRKTTLIVLGVFAASCLLVLIGFFAMRAVTASGFGRPTGDDASATSEAWTLSVDYEPRKNVPAPIITFRADPDNPMPEEGYVHPLGETFPIGGTIYSNRRLTAVTVSISCAHNTQKPYPYRQTVRLLPDAGAAGYALDDANTEEGKSLAELVDFSELLVGVHTLKIVASCEGMKSAEIFRTRFYVAGDEWETITKENFPDSYPEALAFFKDTKRFLYRYQWVNGRYILADPEWEKEFITAIEAYPNGEPWNVHIDAVPYFEKAFAYLAASRVRVHGTNGDSGVIKAVDLITEYNGCYVSRFTSSLKAISHHTFGTAVDLNASMEPNKNTPENKAVIDDDVRDHLTYNGIRTEGGVSYYDFTYDGAYPTDPNGIPQTCVNYLLYEFGFYRAGFLWAHYYKATSDGMHFCLSEFVTLKHDGENGLRKVFEYISTPEIEPIAPMDTKSPNGTGAPQTDVPQTQPPASAEPTGTATSEPTETPAQAPTQGTEETAAPNATPAP